MHKRRCILLRLGECNAITCEAGLAGRTDYCLAVNGAGEAARKQYRSTVDSVIRLGYSMGAFGQIAAIHAESQRLCFCLSCGNDSPGGDCVAVSIIPAIFALLRFTKDGETSVSECEGVPRSGVRPQAFLQARDRGRGQDAKQGGTIPDYR